MNINYMVLGGRITKDIELKKTTTGISVVNFSIAVNRRGKDADTDFFDCVAFRGTAEFIEKYFRKGSGIFIIGAMQTDNWTDKDGKNRKSYTVVVNEVQFADSKAAGDKSAENANVPDLEPLVQPTTEDDELPF